MKFIKKTAKLVDIEKPNFLNKGNQLLKSIN